MILLDTSVLSLAFRRKPKMIPEAAAARTLRHMIEEDLPVAIPGMVLQELLSGVRTTEEFERLNHLLEGFPAVLATREHHVSAARIANACRRAGIAASTIDCLIAAMAIATNSKLFTTDEDFKHIAPHCGLRLLL